MRRSYFVPLLALLATTATQAQTTAPVGISADFGGAFPLGSFKSDGAKAGLALGATATLRLTSVIGVYASVERTRFPVKSTAPAPGDGTWTDTGLGAGLRFWMPLRGERRLRPWAQLGLALHDLDAPIAGPQYAVIDTKGLRTIESGAGIDIGLGSRNVWFLRPIVRYRRYQFSVESPSAAETSRMSYLTFGVGLVMALGANGTDVPAR